jgi:hypothetical protein
MLKKREVKLIEKTQNKKPVYTPEDKEIIKIQKQVKRVKRKENAQTEEDFDELYKNYEKKLLKRLAGNVEKGGHAFEEVDCSN